MHSSEKQQKHLHSNNNLDTTGFNASPLVRYIPVSNSNHSIILLQQEPFITSTSRQKYSNIIRFTISIFIFLAFTSYMAMPFIFEHYSKLFSHQNNSGNGEISLMDNQFMRTSGNKMDGDDIVKGIVSPEYPIQLSMEELQAFVFRTHLEQPGQSETVVIYLAKGSRSTYGNDDSAEILSELGRLNVAGGAIRDYMMLWAPKTSDGVDENGGDNYFLMFKRSKWWGWKQEVIYESDFLSINANKNSGSLIFQ